MTAHISGTGDVIMELQQLGRDFSVCKLDSAATVDVIKEFTFVSITDDEISLVCETSCIPSNATDVESGWKGLKISGIQDFGMIGVIAKISGLLAEQGISIFVISTFNTDYVLLKEATYDKALGTLRTHGYSIVYSL
jgi:hypothetical protein